MGNELRAEETIPQSKMKRIASLDFLRGLAIWMMVFLHVFNHKYDYSWIFDVGIENIFSHTNGFFAGFILFSGFFGNWIGLFILISGIVNTISFVKRISKGTATTKVFLKQILTGIGILAAGFITESFGYYGYFGTVIKSGEVFSASTWTEPTIVDTITSQIFRMEALQIIGWCMIVIAVYLFFLMRNGGHKKVKRNLIITAIVIVLLAIATPFVWWGSESINWAVHPSFEGYDTIWPSMRLQYFNWRSGSYFMMILSGDYYPLFPFLMTSMVGVCFGLALSMEKPPKRLPLWGLIAFLVLLSVGVLFMVLGFMEVLPKSFLGFDVTFDRPTYAFYFLLLAFQVGLVTLMLRLVEYRGKSQKFGNNFLVKYLRTWGTISLTIFALQIYHLVPYAIFNTAFPSVDVLGGKFTPETEWWILLLAFVTILFYDLLIWLWGRINFFFSFEWMIIKFTNIASKEKSTDRLNHKKILNEIEWMDYKELSGRKRKRD